MYMLSNVLKNLSRKYATRLYPFQTRPAFEGFRGRLVNKIEDCIFCKSCQTEMEILRDFIKVCDENTRGTATPSPASTALYASMPAPRSASRW